MSIGEMKRTTRQNEMMFATARGVVFGHLSRSTTGDQALIFNENSDEKYPVQKGVDSVIEYVPD